MKWLLILYSLFKPLFPSGLPAVNPIDEFKDFVRANSVRVIGLFAAASALSTIFAAGVVIFAIDIGAQYDQNAYVYFSSMMMMGLILSLGSLVTSVIVIRNTQSNYRKERRATLNKTAAPHPIQDAIALLITDIIKERELKRANEEVFLREKPKYQTTESNEEILKH